MKTHGLTLFLALASCQPLVSRFAAKVVSDTVIGSVRDGTGDDVTYLASASTWSANWSGFGNADGIVGYDFNVSSDASCAGDVAATRDVGLVTAMTLNDVSLADGHAYFSCVRARAPNGASAWAASNGATIDLSAPAPPPNLVGTAGYGQASISWGISSDAGAGVDTYEIGYCQPAPCALPSDAQVTGIPTNALAFGLDDCQSYDIGVRAKDRVGNVGAYSAPIVLYPQTPAPTGLSVVTNPASAELTWNPVLGADDYDVCYSAASGACADHVVATAGRQAIRLTALSERMSYFAVRARHGTCTSIASVDAVEPLPQPTIHHVRHGAAAGDHLGVSVAVNRAASGNTYWGFGAIDHNNPKGAVYVDTVGGTAAGLEPPDPPAGDPFSSSSQLGEALMPVVANPYTVGGSTAYANTVFLTTGTNAGGKLIGVCYPACTTNYSLVGPAGDFTFGFAIANLGDINADGALEYAVSDQGANSNVGAVYLFSFPATTPYTTVNGATAGAGFGSALAAVDLTGDGVPELLVGAPSVGTGTVYIYDGASLLPTKTPTLITGGQLSGVSASDRFGYRIAVVGDTDGDGTSDFAISGENGAGRVEIHSGKDLSLLQTLSGDQVSGNFGSAVAGVGDVDNDGLADLAVGAVGEINSNNSGTGMAFIYSGNGTSLFRLEGVEVGDLFGSSVTGGIDADDDGHSDFAVGASSAENQAGNVTVFGSSQLLGARPSQSIDASGAQGYTAGNVPFSVLAATLTGIGGGGRYSFSLLSNHTTGASGAVAQVTSDGQYKAGTLAGTQDTVRVTDNKGRTHDIFIRNAGTPPPILRPTSLSAQATSASVVQLTWTDASSNEDGFIIEARTPGESWTQVGSAAPASESATVTNLTPNSDIFFRVKAFYAKADSLWSREAAVVMPAQ